MKSTWRYLIACMLLVLLPLQGFAVASRMACAMDMPASQALASTSTADNEHCQPQIAKQADAKSAYDRVGKTTSAHGNCKSSAPCCMGIALMPAAQGMVFIPFHSDAQSLPVSLPASVSPALLERPPRLTLI
ncbi:hypothetical protein ACO0K9_13710 [Undibacterium sp. Ji50W]|uniref:hypothetical protein n=1 Tax=Undibacterium sp. Ji50W TaxID=3413041 RepID=UPI003BF02FF2